jgi:linoleate 8R-lipoxygenase/9,12-octadecadienoate 8-hydroperoxide 8R-isomerase
VTQQLGELVIAKVEEINVNGFADMIDRLHHHTALTDYGLHMIRRL